MAHPAGVTVVELLALALGGLWLRGAALLPEVSGGRLLCQLRLPPESGLPLLTQAVEYLRAQFSVASVVTRAGVDPRDSGGQGGDLGLDLRQGLLALGGAEVEVLPAGNLTEPGREALAAPKLLRLMGQGLGVLGGLASQVLEKLKGLDGLTGLIADGTAQGGQLQVRVDREAAAAQGVNVSQIAQELRRAVQGEVAGKLLKGDRETDIRVRLRADDRQDPVALGELPLATPNGHAVRLRQVFHLWCRARSSAAAAQVPLPAGYELHSGSQSLAPWASPLAPWGRPWACR